MDTVVKELADKFWDLENYVTGFAALQMVATLFALKDKDAYLRFARVRRFLIPALMLAGIASLLLVLGASHSEMQLREAAHQPDVVIEQARVAAWGRVAVIGLLYFAGGISVWLASQRALAEDSRLRQVAPAA